MANSLVLQTYKKYKEVIGKVRKQFTTSKCKGLHVFAYPSCRYKYVGPYRRNITSRNEYNVIITHRCPTTNSAPQSSGRALHPQDLSGPSASSSVDLVDVSMPHRSVHPSFRESRFGRSLRNESRLETDVAMAERKRREASLPVMVAEGWVSVQWAQVDGMIRSGRRPEYGCERARCEPHDVILQSANPTSSI